jgi:hypothetical protein
LIVAAGVGLAAGETPLRAHAAGRGAGYPKLFGMNIGAKNYDSPEYQLALSRLDVAILGFYPGWRDRTGRAMRGAVQAIKRINPAILIGQYTVLNEANEDRASGTYGDRTDKLDREDWWLRRKDGGKLQWTPQYKAWDINITEWTRADAQGERYPQWAARRMADQLFDPVPEFDIWYFDNVMVRSRVGPANWKLDGVDRKADDPEIQAAFRRGMVAHWDAAKRLRPGLMQIGNVDSDMSSAEYMGRLQGAFLEGLMGKSWSLETRGGWRAAIDRYINMASKLRSPAIVAFNVHGRVDDYAFFRYAFASCLLGDGYFSYTDEKAVYSSVPWFDEYDVRLGKAIDAVPTGAWSNGVWRRRFDSAMALVNPETEARQVIIEPGWRHLKGSQAPDVNDSSAAEAVSLPPRSGLILVKR